MTKVFLFLFRVSVVTAFAVAASLCLYRATNSRWAIPAPPLCIFGAYLTVFFDLYNQSKKRSGVFETPD